MTYSFQLSLIYVNDLPDWIKTEIKMFADDTKLWNKITEPNDCIKLQRDLDSLQNWSDKWLLRFNPDKCKVMHNCTLDMTVSSYI